MRGNQNETDYANDLNTEGNIVRRRSENKEKEWSGKDDHALSKVSNNKRNEEGNE